MKSLNLKYPLDWQDEAFIRSFPKNLPSFASAELKPLENRFILLFNQQFEYIGDRQSQSHFLMCAYVLAAYQLQVEKKRERDLLVQELTEAFKKFGAKFIVWSMRIMLWLRLYNRKHIESRMLTDIKGRYGQSFEVEEEQKKNQYTMLVGKCGFHDFFKRSGYPELTFEPCAIQSYTSHNINKTWGVWYTCPQPRGY
ncbi:MAG: hypothetical protein AAF985_10195 [Bacteroidota bacterium]